MCVAFTRRHKTKLCILHFEAAWSQRTDAFKDRRRSGVLVCRWVLVGAQQLCNQTWLWPYLSGRSSAPSIMSMCRAHADEPLVACNLWAGSTDLVRTVGTTTTVQATSPTTLIRALYKLRLIYSWSVAPWGHGKNFIKTLHSKFEIFGVNSSISTFSPLLLTGNYCISCSTAFIWRL